MTTPDDLITRFPILACPSCRGGLEARQGMLACRSCGEAFPQEEGVLTLIGSTSTLNPDEVATQDEVSTGYADARYQRDYSLAYHRSVLERMTAAPAPAGTVLDNGCGPGLLMDHLVANHPRVDQVAGIDVSRGMLRQATQRLHANNDVFLFQADACRLPFADASFDVVYARGLLHHLPDPAEGVREIHRVLKPGGTVVVLEPNKNVISALPRLLARRSRHFDRDHKNFAASYLQRIVSNDLQVERVSFFGYIAYFVLGFPDIVDFGRVLPMRIVAPVLTFIDDVIARIPWLRRLGWGTVIVATKPEPAG